MRGLRPRGNGQAARRDTAAVLYKPGALDHLAEISAHGLRFAPILA